MITQRAAGSGQRAAGSGSEPPAVQPSKNGRSVRVQDVVLGDDLPRYAARVRTRPLYVIVPAPSAAAVRGREAGRPKTGYGRWTVDGLDRALREETPRVGL